MATPTACLGNGRTRRLDPRIAGPEQLGDAEVQNLDRAIRPNLDVGWLQIAMDDAAFVSRFERVGELLRDAQRFAQWERSDVQAILQGLTVDQFEDEDGARLRVRDAVDRRDVWMVHRGQKPRFAVEACESLGIARKPLGQHLQRHVATQGAVVRAVHLSHAARANRREDFIRTQAVAWIQRLQAVPLTAAILRALAGPA